MEIIIRGEPKEIAALALEAQGRQGGLRDPLEEIGHQADFLQHRSKPEEYS